jgi:hypothetical protein
LLRGRRGVDGLLHREKGKGGKGGRGCSRVGGRGWGWGGGGGGGGRGCIRVQRVWWKGLGLVLWPMNVGDSRVRK